ncbi:MAG: MFS transporter [Bacteriovoracaceae bacterium]
MENTADEMKALLRKERLYVLILAAIQVAHIMDFVIMMPLGPRFMRVFNITPVEFASLVSAYTFSAGIVGFFGALYADHFDRKKFLIFNFTGFILGTFMCGISTNFATLLTARIIAGAFGGILNACVLSLVADLIPFQRRGAAMGIVMSSFSVSSVVGIPIGLWIAEKFDWHYTFYFICAVGSVFWVLSLFVLPSVKVERPKSFMENLKKFRGVFKRDYMEAFCLTSCLAFGIFHVIPFIAPYLVKNVGFDEADLPFMYLCGGIGTIITARIVGKLTDRLGSFTVFRFLALISMIPIIALTNLPPAATIIVLTVTTAFTMFGSARFIPAMTMVSGVVKPEERGTFMSLENAGRQFASGAASQTAGLIIGSTAAGALTGYNIVGIICIASSFIAIFIAAHIRRKYNFK